METMSSTALTLFIAGILTILLPCVLPLLPIVLGVSIADRDPRRPLAVIIGMVTSFVAFTFLLQVLLRQFIEFADLLRIAMYDVLLLFGVGFLTSRRAFQRLGAVAGGLFFLGKGMEVVAIAIVLGVMALEAGGWIAARIQRLGADIQERTRAGLGVSHALLSAFIIGMTLGLVWVPCAGPALGFALTVVRDEPGIRALKLLLAYATGAALPLLLVGYGGQWAVQSVRFLHRYTGRMKQTAGILLILSALGFQYGWFLDLQTWLVTHTRFGTLGTDLEERLFRKSNAGTDTLNGGRASPLPQQAGTPAPSSLPRITRAPELAGLGPWHNSPPLTMKGLKGKVVLVDFWTYSCINCIRTLPYIQGYWNKYKDQPFMLIGVHTPEFVFEKSEKNVADAIRRHGLTYPVAQDNGYATWNAFANHYWPAKYLIDAKGSIRYVHFGEGNYEETDEAIASLLTEIGKDVGQRTLLRLLATDGQAEDMGTKNSVPVPSPRSQVRGPISPETYLGARSWPAFAKATAGRSTQPDDDLHHYVPPASLPLHAYTLSGDWQLRDDERQVLQSSEGEIRMHVLAGEINLVLGLEEGAPAGAADVFVDDAKIRTITIDHDDLYNLFKGDYGEHDLVLKIRGAGVEGYAFTFGG